MLDVEFAQLSDHGRVRDHNEDYLGYVSPATPERGADARLALRAGRRSGRAGAGRSRFARRRWKACSPASARLRRGAACGIADPAGTGGQHARVYEAGSRAEPGGVRHGHHPGGLRPALRPRGGGARGRFALLPDPQARPYAALTRDHTVANEQLRLGMLSARGGGQLRTPPRAQPVARERSVRECGHQRASGVHRRRAGALLRRPARARSRRPIWPTSITGPGRRSGEAAATLVELANERDGSDNISVQLIRVRRRRTRGHVPRAALQASLRSGVRHR